MIATDNSTVSYVNKQGGTDSPTLLRLAVELLLWLEVQNDIVRARHFLGCLNVIADHLSRPKQPTPTEWSLHPEIVRHIFRFRGTLEIDMYATVSNFLLPQLMPPIPDPRAIAVDALSQVWQGRSMYIFPFLVNVHVSPIPPAQQSYSEGATQKAEMILIAPGGRISRVVHIYFVYMWNTR